MIVISVIIERRYWQRRSPLRQAGLREIWVNGILAVSYKSADALAVAIYVFALYDWVAGYGIQLNLPVNTLTWLLVFVCVDLAFYFTHLCMHKVRWCWASHVTHHSSPRYNFTTALRQNFTVAINGTLLIWWLPLALLGFDKHMVLLMMELNLLYQFLLHTEMPTPLDKLGWIMNTPSHHRVHHGSNPAQIDRNFGGSLIIWDRLFGTFRAEAQAGHLRYGVHTRPPRSQQPCELVCHEWRNIWQDLLRYRNLKVLWKAPDWSPESNFKSGE